MTKNIGRDPFIKTKYLLAVITPLTGKQCLEYILMKVGIRWEPIKSAFLCETKTLEVYGDGEINVNYMD